MDIDIKELLSDNYESVRRTAKEHVKERLNQVVNSVKQKHFDIIREIESQQSTETRDLLTLSVENGLIRVTNMIGVELFCKLKVDQLDSGPVLFSETFFMPNGLLTIDPSELLPMRLERAYILSVYGLKDNRLSNDFSVYG